MVGLVLTGRFPEWQALQSVILRTSGAPLRSSTIPPLQLPSRSGLFRMVRMGFLLLYGVRKRQPVFHPFARWCHPPAGGHLGWSRVGLVCCCCRGLCPPAKEMRTFSPVRSSSTHTLRARQGFVQVELVGPSVSRPVDAEHYKKQVRGRGVGRKPHDLIVKMEGEAARLQLVVNFSSRPRRNGMTVKYSQVVGATPRKLREKLEAQDTIHLCRNAGCTHAAALHCDSFA